MIVKEYNIKIPEIKHFINYSINKISEQLITRSKKFAKSSLHNCRKTEIIMYYTISDYFKVGLRNLSHPN